MKLYVITVEDQIDGDVSFRDPEVFENENKARAEMKELLEDATDGKISNNCSIEIEKDQIYYGNYDDYYCFIKLIETELK